MDIETDVLIVGAGPVGLTLAIGLARAGIDFLIVDSAPSAQPNSRAAVIHAATLESLDRIGAANDLIAQGLHVPDFRIRNGSSVLFNVDFSTLAGPVRFALMIPQDETEAVLTAHLASFGHHVIRSRRVEALTRTGAKGARVHTAGPEGAMTISARLIVGADGESSVTRTAAGISFPGTSYGSFMLADVHMDWPIPPSEVSLFFSPHGMLVVAPMSGARHRVVAQLGDAPSRPDVALVQQVLDQRGPGSGVQIRDVIWGSRFRVHHRLAAQFRDGPFLLMGDAAHVHSPAGGQGMNLGIRDAVAAAEAISAYLRAPANQLDDYALSQRGAAARVLARTERLTALATLRGRMPSALRDSALRIAGRLPSVRHRAARMLAGYD